MRATCTAAAVLLGATALLALAAPAALATAPAKGVDPARVSPAQAEPGQTVTISVTCETSSVKTISANSQAFAGGSATLTVGPDGKFTGKAQLASKEEFGADGPNNVGKQSSWGIDGKCPNGDTFTGVVSVERGDRTASDGRVPHGGVKTGLGGSIGTGTGELASGGALVAAGIGGFWLLRRRTDDRAPL